MSKLSTAVTGAVVALGVVALYLLPVARLLLTWACLGFGPLTLLFLIEAAVALARAVSPMRSTAWFKRRDADLEGITHQVIAMEIAISTLAIAVIGLTARWWQPIVGYAPPFWLIALVALRSAGAAVMTTLASLKRPIGGLALLLDMAVSLPLIALLTRSVEGVVIGTTIVTLGLAVLTARSITTTQAEKVTGKKILSPMVEMEPNDRWRLGSWLASINGYLKTPVVAAVGGPAMLVPFSASMLVLSMLMLPFCVAATVKQSRSMTFRVLRGVLLAGAAFLLVHELGPAAFRALFPASFGDGAWLTILAWCSTSLVPIAMRTLPTRAGQLRTGIAAVLAATVLIGLAITHGITGAVWAVPAGGFLCSAIAMSRKTRTEPLISA